MIVAAPPKLLTVAARWNRGQQTVVVAILLLVAALVDPDHPAPIDVCLWKRFTGWPCPTCGLTRAVCHAMRGEWAASLHFHPAGLLVVAGLAGWAVWSACEAWRGRPILEAAREWSGTAVLRASVAVSLASWTIRLVSGVFV